MDKKRVLLGMSGGIDSTVAAILLLEQGYELVGATFRTMPLQNDCNNSKSCCAEDTIFEAQKIANQLGFEHHILDFQDIFNEHVIQNFICEYKQGRTPNPCVLCNSYIKWGQLMRVAELYNCDYIATGHYAQIAEYRGHYYLKNAVDTSKDQTYFLWMLTEENLRKTIFPLGQITKVQVRQIAKDHGFETLAKKPESQDICFIPKNDYRAFLTQQGIAIKSGNFVDASGKVLGVHNGYSNYTIGQRKGLGIALGTPKYVISLDAQNNIVTLGNHDELYTNIVHASDVRLRDRDWLRESPEVKARIRYRSPAVCGNLSFDNELLTINFSSPVWGVTPGQSLVIYKNGLVVGGGIIS